MKNKVITSWDDGKIEDLKIAELLCKYKIPAIFYIPTTTELKPEQIKGISQDFEIGAHTWSHPSDMKLLNDRDLEWEIRENKILLENIIGRPITKFCYPRGRHDARVRKAVADAGFTEGRTTIIGWTETPADPFQMHTTVHVYQRSEYNGVPWEEYARRKFLEAQSGGGYFHLWGHSYEVARDGNWEKLEELFKWINENLAS